jgi:hypothetical protein
MFDFWRRWTRTDCGSATDEALSMLARRMPIACAIALAGMAAGCGSSAASAAAMLNDARPGAPSPLPTGPGESDDGAKRHLEEALALPEGASSRLGPPGCHVRGPLAELGFRDEHTLVIGDLGEVWTVDARSCTPLGVFTVGNASLSANGAYAATVGDAKLRIIDQQGRDVRSLERTGVNLVHVQIADDGETVAASLFERPCVRVWRGEHDPRELCQDRGEDTPEYWPRSEWRLARDGGVIAFWRREEAVVLDVTTGREVATEPPKPLPLSKAVSPSGRLSAYVDDGLVRVMDTATQADLLAADRPSNVACASFSRDGSQVATTSTLGAQLWDVSTGGLVEPLTPPAPAIRVVGIWQRASGHWGWASYDWAGERRVTVTQTGDPPRTFDLGELGYFSCRYHMVALSPDGATVALAADTDETAAIVVLSLATGKTRRIPLAKGHAEMRELVFTPDGARLAAVVAAGSEDAVGGGAVHVVSTSTWKSERTIVIHDEQQTPLIELAADGRTLIVGDDAVDLLTGQRRKASASPSRWGDVRRVLARGPGGLVLACNGGDCIAGVPPPLREE